MLRVGGPLEGRRRVALKAVALARAVVEEVELVLVGAASSQRVVDERLFLFTAAVLNGSEKLATPHLKLPKIRLCLTTQPSEPNRITPAPVG